MAATAFTSGLWFIVILAMIPLGLWLLKRSPAGARFSGSAPAGTMKHIAALPLSASQRLVTVEVGQGESRRWLVLGITPQQITTLHTMLPPEGSVETPPATGPTAPAFAQLLSRLRQDKGAP